MPGRHRHHVARGRHAGEPRLGALQHRRGDAQIVGAGRRIRNSAPRTSAGSRPTSRPAGSVRSASVSTASWWVMWSLLLFPGQRIARGSAAWLCETGRADIRDRRSARGRHRLCLDLRKTAIESGPCLSAAIPQSPRAPCRAPRTSTRATRRWARLSSGSSGWSSSGVVRPADRYVSSRTLLQTALTNAPRLSGVARLPFFLSAVRTRTNVSCRASSTSAGRTKARAKLQGQQIAEIVGEMPLGFGIFCNQPLDVVAVEAEARAKGQRKNRSLHPAVAQPSAAIFVKRPVQSARPGCRLLPTTVSASDS